MTAGLVVGSFVAAAGANTKVVLIERKNPMTLVFLCPIDGKDTEFPASDLSVDALGQASLASEPTCTADVPHKWNIHRGDATLTG